MDFAANGDGVSGRVSVLVVAVVVAVVVVAVGNVAAMDHDGVGGVVKMKHIRALSIKYLKAKRSTPLIYHLFDYYFIIKDCTVLY